MISISLQVRTVHARRRGRTPIAVDPSSTAFADRLYVAWTEVRQGRAQLFFTYSADNGTTWAAPRKVADDVPALDARGHLPNNFMPTLAVSPTGVVGLMWYDRRDNPDQTSFYVRFSASLD